MRSLRLATRNSPLALAQSGHVADALRRLHPGLGVELVGLTTAGDTTPGSLADHGGKGLFTRGVERALLDGRADVAVHSYKDVPVTQPLLDDADLARLTVAAVPTRADVRDVLVARCLPVDLPRGARVGTSSPRRAALLRRFMPGVVIVPLRGNVDTRLARLAAGDLDAVVLAAAGLGRLRPYMPHDFVTARLDPDVFVPAAGQGALAVQCRVDDDATLDLLAPLDHADTRAGVDIERRVVALLEGDCHSPIGAYATPAGGGMVRLRVAFVEGRRLLHGTMTGDSAGLPEQAVAATRASVGVV